MLLVILCFVHFLMIGILFKTKTLKFKEKIDWNEKQKKNLKTLCSCIFLLIFGNYKKNIQSIKNN